jgi:cysteine desulfurase family protein (TIGR01976 family)
MADTETLDVEFCRAQFPPLTAPRPDAYFENAGGSYVPRQVVAAMTEFMSQCQTQPEWPFAASRHGKAMIDKAKTGIAALLGIDPHSLVIGPSTTLNAYVLSHALAPVIGKGDAVVVTNQDHEANGGCWRRLAERGVEVREWAIDPETGDLDPADLPPLLEDGKVKLIAFPHVSNIVGSLNDVGGITRMAHDAGALVCVDGVAAVAHALPDLTALDVDFYMFSFYKLYGPHLAMLYAKPSLLPKLANQNHFFHAGNGPAVLNPGGLNYESAAAIGGILDYVEDLYRHHFDAPENDPRARALAVYRLFHAQEGRLSARFLAWLETRPEIRLIGRRDSDPDRRAPTFALVLPDRDPMAVAEALAERGLCVGAGHFYAHRCVEAAGVDPEVGVLRVSMVHYTTEAEIDRLTAALEDILR